MALAAALIVATTATAADKVNMPARILPAPPQKLSDTVAPFVKIPVGKIALTHVRVIDGTGAPVKQDQTVLIDGAKIAAVQPAANPIPPNHTVWPRLGSDRQPVPV